MSAAPLRVACLGTGYFSRFQYRAWKRLPEVELVALCNRTRASAEAFAAEFAIPDIFTDAAAMLAATKPDLLDIITPPETHLGMIRLAAQAKVDVVCQKPFCRDRGEALQALALADAAGISVIVHENFRFQPWYRAIREELVQERLGRIFQATFRLRPGDGQGPSAYLDRQPYFQRMPRFLVHETAIHLIDVFRFLFGEAASVTALLRRLNPAIAGEDSGHFILDMEGGARCIFDGNRLSDHKARNRRLTMGEMLIEGEKGVLALDGDARLLFRGHGEVSEVPIAFDWNDIDFGGDCVYHFQHHVVQHRLHGAPIENSARDYLTNLKIEDAIYDSDRQGRRITLAGR